MRHESNYLNQKNMTKSKPFTSCELKSSLGVKIKFNQVVKAASCFSIQRSSYKVFMDTKGFLRYATVSKKNKKIKTQ